MPVKCANNQKMPVKCSENAQIKLAAELFQQLDTGHTVALPIQRGAIDANAHTGGDHGHNAAANAAFGGNAHPDGKIAGAVRTYRRW